VTAYWIKGSIVVLLLLYGGSRLVMTIMLPAGKPPHD
jgi:hypothetical protein